MATNLIITIGLRDVQLSEQVAEVETYLPNNSSLFCLSEVRDGSKFLLDNFLKYEKKIYLPIAEPAIKYAIDKHSYIDNIILVSTDQSEEAYVDERYKRNDTYNTALLIEEYLYRKFRKKIGSISHKLVSSGVIFYDDMFTLFDDDFRNRTIFNFAGNDNIILMAQSGIDAINMSLLLNCIQYYPQTIQLHKPENAPRASELNFPHKFHRNLKKVRLINSLENFNYSAVAELDYSKITNLFASYAFSRLIFDYDEAIRYLEELSVLDKENIKFYEIQISKLRFTKNPEKARQREIYLSARILLRQKAYSDFLVRIFSLFEILLKPEVEDALKGKIIFSEPDHEEWNALIGTNKDLLDYLEKSKLGKQKLLYRTPNKFAYKAIREFFIKKEQNSSTEKIKQFNLLYKNLNVLSDLRNQSVHYGMKININDVENALKAKNSSLRSFLALADSHFKIGEIDVYEEINEHMKKLI